MQKPLIQRQQIILLFLSLSLSLSLSLTLSLTLTTCSKPSDYQVIVQEELARGVRYDTLWYGLHFNMSSDYFFAHCFRMNEQGIFFQNGGNQEMIAYFKEDFTYPVEFVFYPNFQNDTIVELPGSFYYPQFNGFNKEYFASKLLPKVKRKIEEWYGGRLFIKIPGPKQSIGDAYAKIDGNRQILLWSDIDNRRVRILFSDLTRKLK